ncbi:hypothetical protein LPJ56_000199 [Coemansia sp. RSA 2599]|nr:hypothetical protein LPJ56_000199 [Coemansia sp. RSA 2599]
MAAAANASNVVHNEVGTGGGAGIGSPEQPSFADSSSLKRKQSAMFSTSGEIDLSMLPPPRAGRPLRSANTDPGMQEARKRARVLRNRAAAQLSREKKRMHLEQLEQENTELKAKNEELEERLSRAEESNKDLSARLDSLAKQMQSFQNLVLGAQQNQQCQAQALQAPQPSQAELQSSLASPAIDWSALTPLNASPLLQGCATPDRSNSTNTVLSYTSAPNTATTSIGTPLASPSSSLEIPMAAPQVSSSTFVATATLPSPASVEPTSATMELFSNTVAASSDLADKGLSESAALEQSGKRIYCVVPDSQQRRPLSRMQSIYRRSRQRRSLFSETASAAAIAAALETYSSTSSSMSWGQRMASMAAMAVVSASPMTSPQALWTIFCVLWWILSQSGGSISRHQLSRIARGILDCPRRDTNSADPFLPVDTKTTTASSPSAAVALSSSGIGGLASLALVSSWLGSRSRTGIALRRVVGSEPVDQVSAFVSKLHSVARTMNSRDSPARPGASICMKNNTNNNNNSPLFYPP